MYEENLNALAKVNPVLASRLLAIEENTKYDVYVDPKDHMNVNIGDTYLGVPLYENVPLETTLKYVDTFEEKYERYPVVYLYGLGNGLASILLLKNENHLRITVIEPEIELIYIAFHLFDFTTVLHEKRLLIFSDDQITFPLAIELFSISTYKVFCKIFHMDFTLPYYATYYGEKALACVQTMTRAIEHVVYGLGNDSTDALIGLEWHVANAPLMAKTPTFYELVKKVKNGTDTAIIISTGPSLAKQLPLLKEIQNHATLMCVDASFPILEKWGIKPDVVFSIERVIETAEFYKRVSPEFQKDVIFALSSLVHPLLPRAISEGTIQMSMRPFGYTRFMKMEEYGYLGIGMSAANMAYELSFHGKFKNIILIGQDLAYGEDGKSHSDGHILGTLKHRDDDFFVEAYGGERTIRTSKVWHMFRNFFEQDISVANEQGVVTVNATEGGARIHGATELSFSDAVATYVDKTCSKNVIKLTLPTDVEIEAKSAQVEERLTRLEEYAMSAQKEVSDLFEDVIKATENLRALKYKENIDVIDFDEITNLMKRIDDIKEKFDDDEFVDVFIDATQALIVHQELELARIQVRAVKTDEDKKLKMIDWLIAHEAWLFGLAGLMDAEVTAVKRAGNESHFVHKAKLSDDGVFIIGNFYDYDERVKDFILELSVDGRVVSEYKHDTRQSKEGSFNFLIPSDFFDNCFHDIMVKEKSTGMVPFGMPVRSVLLSLDRSRAQFIESFDNVDVKKMKDLHCPNSVGFLATKDNMTDADYVSYLCRLMQQCQDLQFIAIGLNQSEYEQEYEVFKNVPNLEYMVVDSVEEVGNKVSFWVQNSKNQLDAKVMEYLLVQFEILYIYVDSNKLLLNLQEYESLYRDYFNKTFFGNQDYFHITENDIKQYSKSFYKLFYGKTMKNSGYNDFDLDLTMSIEEFNVFYITQVIRDEKFRSSLMSLTKKFRQLAGEK